MNYKCNYEYIKNSIFFLISLYIQQENNNKKNEIYNIIKHFLPCTDLSKIYIKNIIVSYLFDNINFYSNHDSIQNLSELNNISDSETDEDFLIDCEDDYNSYNDYILNLHIQKNIDDIITKINNDKW